MILGFHFVNYVILVLLILKMIQHNVSFVIWIIIILLICHQVRNNVFLVQLISVNNVNHWLNVQNVILIIIMLLINLQVNVYYVHYLIV